MVFHRPVLLVGFRQLALVEMVLLNRHLMNANHWNCCYCPMNLNSLDKNTSLSQISVFTLTRTCLS